jgi:hypothetical protein
MEPFSGWRWPEIAANKLASGSRRSNRRGGRRAGLRWRFGQPDGRSQTAATRRQGIPSRYSWSEPSLSRVRRIASAASAGRRGPTVRRKSPSRHAGPRTSKHPCQADIGFRLTGCVPTQGGGPYGPHSLGVYAVADNRTPCDFWPLAVDAPRHKKRCKFLRFLRLGKLHLKYRFYGGYGETGFNHSGCEAEYPPSE